MSRLFQCTALVLLALWLPTTVHCGLETLLGAELETCCHAHDDTSDRAPGQHCTVEEGDYRVADHSVSVTAPPLLASWCAGIVLVARPVVVPARLAEAGESPPELARTWQFSARTALPARAPSIVS